MEELFDLLGEADLVRMPSGTRPKDLAECFWVMRSEELGGPWHHGISRMDSSTMLRRWIAAHFVGGIGWDYSGPRTTDEARLSAMLMAPHRDGAGKNRGGTVYAGALMHLGRFIRRGSID